MAVLNEIEVDGITYTLFDINKIYPVGSIYLSTSSTNPSSLFGGTWEQIKDKFLIGAGNSYSGGATGGSATHTHTNPTTGSTTLTVDQIPSHSHSFGSYNHAMTDVGVISGGWGSPIYQVNSGTYLARGTSISPTGGGQGHTHTMGSTGSTSNIPPYLAVYMWKRTA